MVVFVINAYLVVQNGVKANIAKIGYLLYRADIITVALSQRQDCAAGSEHLLPKVGEWGGLGLGVDLDDLLPDGWEGKGEDQGQENEWRAAKSEHRCLSREEGGSGW